MISWKYVLKFKQFLYFCNNVQLLNYTSMPAILTVPYAGTLTERYHVSLLLMEDLTEKRN